MHVTSHFAVLVELFTLPPEWSHLITREAVAAVVVVVAVVAAAAAAAQRN